MIKRIRKIKIIKIIKIKSIKRNLNNNGSVLILLLIIIAVIIFLGVSLMSLTLINYQIKKTNSDIKQSFYMSENGLNESYVNAHELMINAVNDSIEKAENYLLLNPVDELGALNIYKDNFKSYILSRISSSINDNSNPIIIIINAASLYFIGDNLTVSVQSKYISPNNIEKATKVDLKIIIPNYNEAISKTVDYSKYLKFDNYNIVY
jgi:predicted PurR-regulated permease PerM